MKISRNELQNYFRDPLPSTEGIADAFTSHCFEIEEVAGDLLDIKVLPNRVADCSSEAGIAAELSTILDLPMKDEPAATFSDTTVDISLARINAILGARFSQAEVEDVFRRLRFRVEKDGESFRVAAPAFRTDIGIPEEVAEEVGRILGYERIPAIELPPLSETPEQARYRGIERKKDMLVAQGFTEVSTQSFAAQGDVFLANPLDKTRPALRTSLEENLRDALARARHHAPLVFPPKQEAKLFEVGTVFPKEGEYLELRTIEHAGTQGKDVTVADTLSVAGLEEYGKGYAPKRYRLSAYKPFSLYPFITRDIALWVPPATRADDIQDSIRAHAGAFLVRLDQFDQFSKEGKVSYAFRLVFQSMERTLTDEEVNGVLENITAVLGAKGYEVR
ncbi:MAG: phenylalanine--tRNA ligase subunit beta-related protein [Minisyncoccota bacterium]